MSRGGRLVALCGLTVAIGANDYPHSRARPVGGASGTAAADTLVSQYDVDGITVIQRRGTTGEIVAARVYLLGGSRQVDASTAGIEALLLRASEYGTASYPGAAAREALSRTGSFVGLDVGADWTTLGFVGLGEEFDSTWAVVADRIAHPTLDSTAVAIARRHALAAVNSRTDSPEEAAEALAESLSFVGHRYEHRADGTVGSLTTITPAMVREYHAANMVSSRMLVVVAGNVTRSQVEGAVRRTLAKLPRGTYKWTLPERWQPKAPAVIVRRQQLPTNYLIGVFGGPPASSGDIPALTIGLQLLSGEIFGPMRDSGLTYAAGAGLIDRGASGGLISVSTGDPERAMKIINNAIELIARQALLNPRVISSMQLSYLQSYSMRTETSDAQVDVLARSYLFNGDVRYQENYANALRQVSPQDIQRAMRAYVKNIQYAFVGDTLKVPRAAMTKY